MTSTDCILNEEIVCVELAHNMVHALAVSCAPNSVWWTDRGVCVRECVVVLPVLICNNEYCSKASLTCYCCSYSYIHNVLIHKPVKPTTTVATFSPFLVLLLLLRAGRFVQP